jgi:hypothetical protein
VLLETDGGFVTLDPRAAHERVLYERLLHAAKGKSTPSQRLLIPVTVRLPPEDARRIADSLDDLRSLGFELDEFGRDSFIVEGLPPDVPGNACRELLADIAGDLEASGARRGKEHRHRESAARAAARAALRGRAELAPAELDSLIAALARTRMPYTCPRGRPTMIFTLHPRAPPEVRTGIKKKNGAPQKSRHAVFLAARRDQRYTGPSFWQTRKSSPPKRSHIVGRKMSSFATLCMSTGMRSIALKVMKSAPMRPSDEPSWLGPMRLMYSNEVMPRGIQ